MVGKTIKHYKILKKLGEGGMGVVYKAEDTKLHRMVALKFLPHGSSENEEAKQRFINEARAASALDHPNICTLHEIGDTRDGQMYMTMAYYGGQSLKEKIDQGPLPVTEAVDFAIQATRGLARAHEEDISHRDIKPANLMVTERGEVK
ncbi:MAG: serine/threonine-protein kinase, partial [bacterium]